MLMLILQGYGLVLLETACYHIGLIKQYQIILVQACLQLVYKLDKR